MPPSYLHPPKKKIHQLKSNFQCDCNCHLAFNDVFKRLIMIKYGPENRVLFNRSCLPPKEETWGVTTQRLWEKLPSASQIQRSHQKPPLPAYWYWTSGLQNGEQEYICCVSPTFSSIPLSQPKQTNSPKDACSLICTLCSLGK